MVKERKHCCTGYIETDENERSILIRQNEILENADLLTISKSFNLQLDQFGPYKINYNPNGKRLLLGGMRGHLASFDLLSKNLLFEIYVQEKINALSWLHDETMLAVAQKEKVFVYDINGIELHKIKYLHETVHLEFLPHHFLLVSARKKGSLSYFDTSMGVLISDIKTCLGKAVDMCQNSQNGIIALAHTNGNTTMWSPKQEKPIVKMLCHASPLSSLSIDFSGNYMATGDMTRYIKIWDMRTYKLINEFRVHNNAINMCFSQTGLLAFSMGNRVEIYNNVFQKPEKYLRQDIVGNNRVTDLKFCPFEDVLGIGHENGFLNMIIPGSGEPNIDSLNPNPYQTKDQRKEYGVRKLLEKIQPEMITLDVEALTKMGKPEKSELEIRQEIMFKRLMPKNPKYKNSKNVNRAVKQVNEQLNREKKKLKLIEKYKMKNN